MRLPGLAPILPVELLGSAPRYRQRLPPLASVDSGHEYDLTDVVAGMPQRAFQRQRNGMRFPANGDHLSQVFQFQALQCLQQAAPAALPEFQDLRATLER